MTTQTSTAIPSQLRLSWIVAEREITTRLRSKAFIISTAILMIAVLAGVVIAGIMQKNAAADAENPEPVSVVVVGEPPAQLASPGFETETAADRAAAEQLVESGDVDAAVLSDAAGAVTVLARDEAPEGLISALTIAPNVELLSGGSGGFNVFAYFAAMAFGMVFYITALTFGTTIAQSVVEEKQTRIVEILLATVSSRALMAGKILGNSLLAIGTVILILALASVAMLATGQDLLLGELGLSLIWFGILFAFGFVLVATLYAAAASMVSRQEDIGSVTSPVMMLVMIPFFLVIFFYDDEQVLAILSYVPFSAPVGMPMRLVLGTAQWWEPILSLAVICVTIAIIVVFAARIYRNSILRTGARVKFADALRG